MQSLSSAWTASSGSNSRFFDKTIYFSNQTSRLRSAQKIKSSLYIEDWSDKYRSTFYLYFGTLLMAQIWRKHVPKEALIETLEKWRPNKWIITELNDNTIFRKDILLLVVESKEENFENWLKILKIERLNSKSGICCQTSMFTVHSDRCIIR